MLVRVANLSNHRTNYSTERAGESGSGDQVTVLSSA